MRLANFEITFAAAMFERQVFLHIKPFKWKYAPFSRGSRGQTYLGLGPIYMWSRVYDPGCFDFEISIGN